MLLGINFHWNVIHLGDPHEPVALQKPAKPGKIVTVSARHGDIRWGLQGAAETWMDVDKELPGIILIPGLFSARADDLILQFCFFSCTFIKNFGNNGPVVLSFPA